MKRMFMLLLSVGMFAGCEAPVDPSKIKVQFFEPQQKLMPVDKVVIELKSGAETAEPGEKVSLSFEMYNTVRDEVFVQMDESAAYVASLVIFMPGDLNGRVYPLNAPPVNPAASAGSYKRLLPPGKGGTEDRVLTVNLPVALPKVEWEKVEISVVFSVRGYTRETRGEFRDTVTRAFAVNRRKAVTQPAPNPNGGPGFFVRPVTRPAQ